MSIQSFAQFLAESHLPSDIQAYGESQLATLSAAERRLLTRYAAEMYKDVNAVLRGEVPLGYAKPMHVSPPGYARMMGGAAKVMDRIFARYALPRALTVYRGTYYTQAFSLPAEAKPQIRAIDDAMTLGRIDGERVLDSTQILKWVETRITELLRTYVSGKTISMPGFMSVSTDLDTAKQFAELWVGGVVLQLTLPAGTSAIPLVGDLVHLEEAELLLPHNTKFYIPPFTKLKFMPDTEPYRIPILDVVLR